MAYNSSKGPQTHGDVQYEGDPAETQIDFEDDFIALKTSGSQVLVVSGSRVGIGMSTPGIHPNEKNDLVIGNQTGHRGMTIASGPTSVSTIRFTYATAANNGEGWIDYSNNSKKMRFGTNGLNTRVTVSAAGTDIVGQMSASLGVTGSSLHTATTIIDPTHLSSSLNVSASALYVDVPGLMEIHKSDSGHAQLRTQTAHFQIRNKANNKDIRFQLGDDAGSTGVKVRNNSSAEVASIDSQGDAILRHLSASLGITGSSLHTPTSVVNATHVSSSLAVSASSFWANGVQVGGGGGAVSSYTNAADNRILTSVNSSTINGEARLTFDNSTNFLFLSGNAQIRNHLPYLFFSNSSGTGLGYMGYNSANNILVQNNTQNAHIVFKANDGGVIKEGFRIDGAVPEVVVNQTSDSLINFRVESDNKTHMLYVQGSTDRIGVNCIPNHTLSVSGSTSISGSTFVTGSLTTLGEIRGKQLYYTHHHFVGAANNSWFPFITNVENTNANEVHSMVTPHDGRLVKILYRVQNNQNTSFTLKLYKGINGVAEIDSGGAVEVEAMTATLPASDSATVTFVSSGSVHFNSGDIVGIKNGTFSGATADIQATCIWEYDQLIP